MDYLEKLAPYVPLLRTALWILLALFASMLFYRQLKTLVKTLLSRVESGSLLKAGPFEVGEDLRDLKHVNNQADIPVSKEVPGSILRVPLIFSREISEKFFAETVIPDNTLKYRPIPLLKDSLTHFIKFREDTISQNQGLFLAHVLEPSKTSGQKYDIFIFLVRHRSKDFSDIDYIEFF